MRRSSSPPRTTFAAVLVACLLLGACEGPPNLSTHQPTGTTSSSAAGVPSPIDGEASCDDPSPIQQLDQGVEVEGHSEDGAPFWVLFGRADTLRSGRTYPVAFRVGGDGSLEVVLVGTGDRIEDVRRLLPAEPTTGWDRPGEPWIGGVRFPQPGCWRIYAERRDARGSFFVNVS